MIFQPTMRQFHPLSATTTSLPTSDSHISDASNSSPPPPPPPGPRFPSHQRASTPQQHLYPLVSLVSPPNGRPIPTILSTQRVSVEPSQGQQIQGTLVDLAYDPQNQIYLAMYPVQVEEPMTAIFKTGKKCKHKNTKMAK